MIEIYKLTKTYGNGKGTVEALRGVNLSIEAGEIFGVIGLSGAGKSTLIRCLNRLETPTTGQVLVDGQDLTCLSDSELRLARREMGMIFQHFNLLSSRTVAGNVAFPMEIAGQPKSVVKPRVEELLELVGLADKAKAYPSQLSGGQKQRVGIARALANNPKVLLCDEATSALDPQTTQSILALIQDVKNRLGLTVVLITHEMKVITEICDRVAVMEDGVVVESGPVIDVFTRPRHPTSRSFVDVVINQTDSAETIGYKPKGTLVRILFIGEAAQEPMISSMIKRFRVESNILQGRIDHIKGTAFGTLLLDLEGEPSDRRQALRYLNSLNLTVEVLANDPDA
ncbi:methionine ABC transporter ATP-binding protein [Deltaproteobacteria bacterium Smac51]|nr:methionine ABC transporter ATP-binding protein [Deltaproteobacteria bacterium Smac51]